jgi:hypothetical protein
VTGDREVDLFEQAGLVPRSDYRELRDRLVEDTETVAPLAAEAAKALDDEETVDAGLVPPKGATVGWWRRRRKGES